MKTTFATLLLLALPFCAAAQEEVEPATGSDSGAEQVAEDSASTPDEAAGEEGTADVDVDVDVDVDAASADVSSLDELTPKLNTRISGNLRSEMHLSQRTLLRSAGAGTYERRSINVYPFYEIISLRADEIGHKGLSIHVQGIAGLDLANVYFDQRFVADPTYAYVQFRHKGLDAQAGRMLVFSGAGEGLHMDGLRASYLFPAHIGVEVLAGHLVAPKQGPDWYRDGAEELNASLDDYGRGLTAWKRESDSAMGGRVFYRLAGKAQGGVSFLQIKRYGEVDHQLLSADVDLTMLKWMALSGKGTMDMSVLALRDAQGMASFFIGDKARIMADYKHVDPTVYLSNLSIFSVFSDQKYNSAGLSAVVIPISSLTLDAGYHQLFYTFYEGGRDNWNSTLELGYQIDAGASLRFADGGGFGRVGYSRQARDGNSVDQLQVGARVPLGVEGLSSAVNGYVDFYKEQINGADKGVVGDLGLYFARGPVSTGGTIAAGITPFYRSELRGMLTFTYKFAADLGKGGAK